MFRDPRVVFAGRKIDMSDLDEKVEVNLQKMLDPFWNLFWCFGAPAIVSHFYFGEPWTISFLVPGVLKYCLALHGTWLVNSVAHYYGDRPYEEINPTENRWVAFAAVGEGWHNYHHSYPYDYAASELGMSEQYK